MRISSLPPWLKSRGYIHITPQININKQGYKIIKKISNPNFIANHAFYPLLHSTLKERKFKKSIVQSEPALYKRKHSYRDTQGKIKKNIKIRPLHYATHIDALIFSYYSNLLQTHYEESLKKYKGLSDSIIAYRKIPVENNLGQNKSTIHFANEVFEEIKKRANDECRVLTFDIKNFFSSLNHKLLKNAWQKLLDVDKLPDDHFNVFKATTLFSYILLDELREYKVLNGRKPGYNEKELANIRNKKGINCFFEDPKHFRDKILSKEIKIYKHPFWDKVDQCPMGIPQGLPISAILSNLYLLEFDIDILNELVLKENCYYRRYSDDIIIICKKCQAEQVKEFVYKSIEKQKLTVSKEKTEDFLFKRFYFHNNLSQLRSIKMLTDRCQMDMPITYLGFEFFGERKAVKSANIAKFYRRMIRAIKSKSRITLNLANKNPTKPPIIFRRQLYKMYTSRNLQTILSKTREKKILKNERGDFSLSSIPNPKKLRSNYLSYLNRASKIMNAPSIMIQIKKHKKVFNDALFKHFYKKLR